MWRRVRRVPDALGPDERKRLVLFAVRELVERTGYMQADWEDAA